MVFSKKALKKEEGPFERGSQQAHKEGVPVPCLFGDMAPTASWEKQFANWEGTTFAGTYYRILSSLLPLCSWRACANEGLNGFIFCISWCG